MNALRGALSGRTRHMAFDLVTQGKLCLGISSQSKTLVEVGDQSENNNITVVEITYHIVLSPFYPSLETPDISVSCPSLSTKVLHDLNARLEM